MLGLQYEPRHGIIDYECWPISKYVPVDIPDYKYDKPLDYYEKWPAYYRMYLPIPEFRTYLNNLLLRDLRVSGLEFLCFYMIRDFFFFICSCASTHMFILIGNEQPELRNRKLLIIYQKKLF